MLARREFFRAAAYTRERSFCRDRCRRLPVVSPRRGHIFRTTSPSNSHRIKVRPERRRLALAPSTRNRLASRASRVSGAPALAIAFLVSVARRKFHPRTRHRVVRRLTRARLPTPSNPPQMASKDGSTFFFTSESVNEGHPDKLADQVRDRAFLDSGALFQRGPSLFRQTGSSENEPRRRRSVASTAIIATCFGRSADETSSPHHPTDLRRCPRCLPRPGSRLQGASPAA